MRRRSKNDSKWPEISLFWTKIWVFLSKISHFKGPGEVLEFQNSIWDALLSSKVVLDLNLEGK